MSLVKRQNSKNYYIQLQINGKTYLKSSKTPNRKLAEKIERKWRDELIEQDTLGTREITIDEAINMFEGTRQGTANYGNVISQTKFIRENLDCSKTLSVLRSPDIERLKQLRAQKNAPATVKHLINVCRGLWKNAKLLGYQVQDVEFPTVKVQNQKIKYLTEEEEQRLLEELDPKREGKGIPPFDNRSENVKRFQQDNYDFVLLIMHTGARHSEIAKLRWNQVDLKSRTINLYRPKVKNESILHMTDEVVEMLERRYEARNNDEWVFTNKSGKAPRNYQPKGINKAFERAGLKDYTLHDLRHNYASKMVRNGMTLYQVQHLLGHTNPSTTSRYSHLETADISIEAAKIWNGK